MEWEILRGDSEPRNRRAGRPTAGLHDGGGGCKVYRNGGKDLCREEAEGGNAEGVLLYSFGGRLKRERGKRVMVGEKIRTRGLRKKVKTGPSDLRDTPSAKIQA